MNRKSKILAAVLSAFYLALLVWVFLFQLQFSMGDVERVRSLNWIPFYDGSKQGFVFSSATVLKDLLLFLPMGIYLQILLPEKSRGWKLPIIVGVSLLLEVLQYCFALGASDSTDLLLNTAGGALGLLIYSTAAQSFRNAEKTERLFLTLGVVLTTVVVDFLALVLFSG